MFEPSHRLESATPAIIKRGGHGLALLLTLLIFPQTLVAAPLPHGQLDLRKDCGAIGDGTADDSLALKSCLKDLQASLNLGEPTLLRIPAGIYRITGANGPMPLILGRGGTITGDGPHATYLVLDRTFAGDLFSWSEAWIGREKSGRPLSPAQADTTGPTLTGLQIDGDPGAPAVQNAIAFYDRDDRALIQNVEIDGVHGQCLVTGHVRHTTEAYVRESTVENFRCWQSGTPTLAAVELGSSTAARSDATNEIDFYKLAILGSQSTALLISNADPYSATRRIRFFGLRVESSCGDGVVIGGPHDRGQVADIYVYGLSVINTAGTALSIGASDAAPPPYGVMVLGGSLGPRNRYSIQVQSGRLVDIQLSSVDSRIKLSSRVGPSVSISRSDPHQRLITGSGADIATPSAIPSVYCNPPT